MRGEVWGQKIDHFRKSFLQPFKSVHDRGYALKPTWMKIDKKHFFLFIVPWDRKHSFGSRKATKKHHLQPKGKSKGPDWQIIHGGEVICLKKIGFTCLHSFHKNVLTLYFNCHKEYSHVGDPKSQDNCSFHSRHLPTLYIHSIVWGTLKCINVW